MNPEPTPRLVFLWNEAWLWLHWILMFEETATKATVPRKLTAFEDYCGRWRYLKQPLLIQRLRNTANITINVARHCWASTNFIQSPFMDSGTTLSSKQCL